MQAKPEALDVVTYGEAMTMFVAAVTGDLAKAGQFTKRVAGAAAKRRAPSPMTALQCT